MRFKFAKGSKVEVLRKREAPSGSWRVAEIISGNGHNYSVRYDHYSPEVGSDVERISRKDMRPCPPPMVGLRSWVPGDIVEVSEDNCWKPAKVLKVFDGGNFFFVRLLGSSREFRAHRSDLRLRQSWKDNAWGVIDKEYEEGYDGREGNLSNLKKFKSGTFQPYTEMKRYEGDDCFLTENDHYCEEPYQISFRDTMKRKQRSCNIETYTGAGRKVETIAEVRKRQRLVASHPYQVAEKVDAVASPRLVFGEKYMRDSLKMGTSQFLELDMHRGNQNDDVVHFTVGSLEPSDFESFSSSVGSSSPSYSPFRSKIHLKTSPSQDLSVHFEDVEAPWSRELSPPRKGGVGSVIHQLELNAYRSTLVALYASGPLNWEREALLTNLRLMLHVTNDEHLLELKHLATIKCNST